MPQIRLECSAAMAERLDTAPLFKALHEMLVSKAGASLEACKSRLTLAHDIYVADGADDRDMVNLEIGLLSGRAQEVLTDIGQTALQMVNAAVADVCGTVRVSTAVRLVDMPPALYFK